MTRRKTAMFAVFSAALCLILCGSMLLNGTFAWFTDNVTNAENIIQSGTLKVGLEYSEDGENWNDASAGKIFDYQLWEPGYTDVKAVQITNKGTLALTFSLALYAEEETVNGYKLSDVIEVYIGADKPADRALSNMQCVGTLAQLMADPDGAAYGVMLPAGSTENVNGAVVGSKTYWIALHMMEEAGNEYQNLKIGDGIAVKLFATQYTYEDDSFDDQYDFEAAFPAAGTGTLKPNASVVTVNVTDENNLSAGTVHVPVEAVADTTKPVEIVYNESAYQGNFTVEADEETIVVDVTAKNLKPDNTVMIPATIRIPAGKNPATVKLYHYDTEIPCTYNPETGFVSFQTDKFSPFTVVYDADSVYVPTNPEGNNLPVAIVEDAPEYVNTDLEWKNVGGFYPTEGLNSKLEAAYTFSCEDTAEEAAAGEYANWYCDFYVKLDRDLGANQIFLGGNYGSFGWVGFHNGDVILKANEEIPLLGSVTQNPWTYAQVASVVNTFICGVGHVGDALDGATFTVMLRLTNPDDATEFYNIETIEYKFQ